MSAQAGNISRMLWGAAPARTGGAPLAVSTPAPLADSVAPAPVTTPALAPVPIPGSAAPASNPYLYGLQEGMTQQDNGDGTFGILYSDQNLGTGYAGVRDAYNVLATKNAAKGSVKEEDGRWSNPLLKSMQEVWIGDVLGGGSYGRDVVQSKYGTQDELNAALKDYVAGQNLNGEMGEWEGLGQALNGGVAQTDVSFSGAYTPGWVLPPSNNQDETISGKNALYGSTPVFSKDENGNYKLTGYRTDLLPGATNDHSADGVTINNRPYGTFIGADNDSYRATRNNWRELNVPEVQKHAVIGADGNAYIPLENVDKIGWTNKDSSNFNAKNSGGGGMFGAIFDVLDPIIDDLVPGHDMMQNGVAELLGSDSQKEAFVSVAGPVVTVVATALGQAWVGAVVNAAQSASTGDWAGVALNALSAAISYYSAPSASGGTGAAGGAASAPPSPGVLQQIGQSAGMTAEQAASFSTNATNLFSGDIAKMTGGMVNFTPEINRVIGASVRSAVMSAVQQGVKGADFDKILESATISALASMVGSSVNEFTGAPSVVGSAAGSVAGGALSSAARDAAQPTAPTAPASRPTSPAPTTPAAKPAPTSNQSAGSLSRMLWS